jgi:hypothetical protein
MGTKSRAQDDEQGVEGQSIPDTEDDTEGHQFLPNEALSRNVAASREREIQRNLQKREVQGEARRPFFRKRKSG